MSKCSYEVKTMQYDELKRTVKLPKFQRSIVWSKDMRKEFIETIRNGLPFGSLLLYDITEGLYKFQLVDGLQRLSTIMDYEENKYDYINLETFAQQELNEIFFLIEKDTSMKPTSALKQLIISIISEEFRQKNDNTIIAVTVPNKLRKEIAALDNTDLMLGIGTIIGKIDNKIKKEIDLSLLTIPVVIFKGEKCELPTIFDRINSNGTKLSKYEIFAAVWAHEMYSIDDKEILEWVDNKYETMIERSGITINGYTPGSIIDAKQINLFEYAYAVGKIVRDKCGEMFVNKETDISQIDSIGFALITICIGGSLKQMDKLPELLSESTPSNLAILKDKLIECSKKVNDILKKYIVTIDGKIYTKYVESQIVSIIATLFKLRYTVNEDISIKNNENSKSLYKKFEKNMPKHYLYDLLKGFWAGSGDTKISDLLKSEIASNIYLQSIPDANWETVLSEWTTEQEMKPSKNVNVLLKLFLNYINKLSDFSHIKYSNYSFDVEHIIPYYRLVKLLKDGPFSAIGNLCLLPSFENRSKKDKTLFEQIDEESVIYNLNSKDLEIFGYADRGELDFIKGNSFTKEQFVCFLKARHNYYIKRFIKLIRNI